MAQVDRFYGVDYGEDIDGGKGGTVPTGAGLVAGPSTGVVTTGKDIEIRLDLGTTGVTDPIYVFLKDNRAQVIAKLQNLVDMLASGRIAWPPPLT
jgi:hypothetical protein